MASLQFREVWRMSKQLYRPEIDGLRAVAIIPVIMFHLNFDWIVGGYLGVDVFFVISGYLISLIILREFNEGKFLFTNFWSRRIRRIFPAMLTMVFVTLCVTWFMGFKGAHPALGEQSVFALLSAANIFFWINSSDYWGTSAEAFPLLHTWSLSVEEQFYLFFPIAIYITHKFFANRINWLLYIVSIVSLLIFFWAIERYPNANFYLLPSRVWELSFGAILAQLSISNKIPNLSDRWAIIGVALIVIGYLFVPSQSPAVVLPVIGTWLIIAYGNSGFMYRFLILPPIVLIGRLSYSLYLWHWPVIVINKEFLEVQISTVGQILIIIALSISSYYLIERPARYAKSTIPFSLVSFFVVLILGGMLWNSSGVYDASIYNKISYHGYYYDLKPDNFNSSRFIGARSQMTLPPREASVNAYLNGGIIVGPNKKNPDIVVFGDSHGVMWSSVIQTITEKLGLTTSFYSMDGVNPLFSIPPKKDQNEKFLNSKVKYKFDLSRIDNITNWKPKLVILISRWSGLKNTIIANETVNFLASNADQVIILGQPPELTFGNRFAVQHLSYRGVKPVLGENYYLPFDQNALLDSISNANQLANQNSNVEFLPTHDLYSRGVMSLVLKGQDVIYYDDDHLTDFGASLAKSRLTNSIMEKIKYSSDRHKTN